MENLDEVIRCERIGLRRREMEEVSIRSRPSASASVQSLSRDEEAVTIWAREFVEMAAISSQFVRRPFARWPNLELRKEGRKGAQQTNYRIVAAELQSLARQK